MTGFFIPFVQYNAVQILPKDSLAKQKARTINDYFKDKPASRLSTDDHLLLAHSDYVEFDELEDQVDDTVSPIPDSKQMKHKRTLTLTDSTRLSQALTH